MLQKLIFKIQLFLIGMLARLIDLTLSYRFVGVENLELAKAQSESGVYILALWHRYALLGVMGHEGQNIVPLASQSKDGEIVAYVANIFRMKCVRGSSNRGAISAVKEILRSISENKNIAITVDGPKGPVYVAKSGIIDIAAKTGAAIVPMKPISSRNWILYRTWDKTCIPKPFSRATITYEKPFFIEKNASDAQRAQYLKKLETCLNT